MADVKLKPCPFCGGEAQIFDLCKVHFGVFYYVECRERKCQVKTKYYSTEEEAAEVWNRRAEPKDVKPMGNKCLGTKIENPNEVTIYDIITVIREYNRTITVEQHICDENDITTLADIKTKDAYLVTVIAEDPLHGEIYRYHNHGEFWEQIGTTCGYA